MMISFEEACNTVLGSVDLLGTEKAGLLQSLGRVLAEDVYSDMDMPPFNKSAMDGFACRREDLGNELEIVETIAAGQHPVNAITKDTCARIMTGAIVPDGADCVIKVEDTQIIPSGKVVFTADNTRSNIAIKGEDIKEGEKVLTGGTL